MEVLTSASATSLWLACGMLAIRLIINDLDLLVEQRVANWIILSILAVGVPSGLCRSKTLYHEPFKQDFEPPSGLRQDALFGYSVTYQPVGTSGR